MDVSNNQSPIHYKNKADSLARKGSVLGAKDLTKPKNLVNPDKVELSKDAKGPGVSDLAKALGKAAGAAAPSVPDVPDTPDISKKEQAIKSAKKVKNVSETLKKKPMKNKPAVFFVEGFTFFGLTSTPERGIGKMASHIPGADFFAWDQKEDMMEEINRRPIGQPIILVGHGMGGDTIVEIANELNTIENGFRKIQLMVTMDSVGANNDILPQNVEKNLNYITEGGLFNDGPNIARNSNKTRVGNFLRTESHGALDDSQDVQFQVFEEIQNTLQDVIRKRDRLNVKA
jgi:hypothetical protein